tara:strand:+ start:8094 stop:9518 length:1425 start_codon:yes stop_codon:yes gene_type:complete
MNDFLKSNSMSFLRSALFKDKNHSSIDYILDWIDYQNEQVEVSVSKICFEDLKSWNFDKKIIEHSSKRFFNIEGVDINTNWGSLTNWQQPIINQAEIGYLGFITKEINGILHFLSQAKVEPGNVNYVQISPTIQATKSNYTQIHKGLKPKYLEFFQNAKPHQVLLDQLQSEQGARFLKKRNRNIIIKLEEHEEITLYDNFIWLSLYQLKELMKYDNIVNMDTRTVLSGISFGNFGNEVLDHINKIKNKENKYGLDFLYSSFYNTNTFNSLESIISKITDIKCNYFLNLTKIPLNKINNWKISESEIFHEDNKYFKIIAVDVNIGNREVTNWTQPMIEPSHQGLCVFICKKINEILHFAVQLKLECGNLDIIEMAPTVQTLTGNYKTTNKGELPFLDYVLNVSHSQIIFDTIQSEEGGRFYKEQNRNMIIMANDIPSDLPENYIWLTLNQLNWFLKFNNYVNIQARNLISSIQYV